jgi:hypothetical protein
MKIFKPIIFSSLLILFTASTALAKLPSVDPGLVRPNITESISKIFANKCDTLKTKITNRVNMFENNEEAHSKVYTKLVDRITEKLAKWKEMGYDVDKLTEDLKTLDTKVKKFSTDYKSFISKLKATQDIACDTGTAFADAMKEARDALKLVRQDAADIRNYYNTVIRPDIIELKQQTPAVKED